VPERDCPHASLVEGLRFTAQVAVPNVVQGLFRRRRSTAAAATRAGVDGLAVGFVSGLRRNYGDGPLWIRVGAGEALLLLGRAATRRGLEGSPDPFAADPEPKRSSMQRFQPGALTISRNPEWEDRRRFTEAVLDTGDPEHRLSERFAEISAEEARSLTHWLFALGDTLAINAFRCLALLASHATGRTSPSPTASTRSSGSRRCRGRLAVQPRLARSPGVPRGWGWRCW